MNYNENDSDLFGPGDSFATGSEAIQAALSRSREARHYARQAHRLSLVALALTMIMALLIASIIVNKGLATTGWIALAASMASLIVGLAAGRFLQRRRGDGQ